MPVCVVTVYSTRFILLSIFMNDVAPPAGVEVLVYVPIGAKLPVAYAAVTIAVLHVAPAGHARGGVGQSCTCSCSLNECDGPVIGW